MTITNGKSAKEKDIESNLGLIKIYLAIDSIEQKSMYVQV
jgi:hypothetical protein